MAGPDSAAAATVVPPPTRVDASLSPPLTRVDADLRQDFEEEHAVGNEAVAEGGHAARQEAGEEAAAQDGGVALRQRVQ